MHRKWLKRAGSASIILGAANAGAVAVGAPLSTNSAYNSGNWSGYDAIAPSGSAFTSISSTWVVPTLTVKPASGTNYVATWIGFDGYNPLTDPPVEQCGIAANISSTGTTSYYAWYEFYPAGTQSLFTVNPGDTINASITYEGISHSKYVYDISISDTTGSSYSKAVTTTSNDMRKSAEWITEAPSISGTVQTLANYGSVTYSSDKAGLDGNPSQNLNTLSYNTIKMTQTGTTVSVPSLISNAGGGFTTDYGSLIAGAWSNGSSNQSWGSFANWSPQTIMTAPGAVANFNSTGAGAVMLNGNQTVGKININSATAYTISQGTGGSLYINDSSDAVANPSINISAGSHTISAPIVMSSGMNIYFQNNTGLTIANTITGGGTMTVNGPGTLTVATNGTLPSFSLLSINTGANVTLAANAAPWTPVVQTVAFLGFDASAGSKLDITNNELLVPNTTPANIRNDIISGNIVSSLSGNQFGVGYGAYGGGTEIRYTLLGDADLDGTVGFSDLLTLASNFGSTTGTWATGDFNYDNTVNFTDLLSLAANYGNSLTPANDAGFSPSFAADWNLAVSEVASSVPEPTSLAILAISGMGLLGRRRMRA